ncbi:MAG: sigma-70 family RNA polymerase sigma factor [Planctomycetota bacterium]
MEPEHDDERESQIVALLTEIQLPLLLYVRSLLPGDSRGRDVAQQANATIWTKRADFELGTNFTAWAFSIARFEVLNYRKQQARDARLVFSRDLEETMSRELADSSNDLQRRHEALQTCLRKLRPKDRELILHRYASAGTLAEYADKVGRSAGGLKVTLHRLRSALLICMKRQGDVEEALA